MNYCPRCGTKLESKFEGGRERPACPAEKCGFFYFGDYSIGCGAVVIRDDKALLIQRGINPNRGAWQIPGGYVESDEEIFSAVEREVLEEAGVVASVSDVIGFRHASGGRNTNIYVVFRLLPVSGEPRYDGEESIGAGYFSLDEIARMERVQALSTWAIQQAFNTSLGAGLTLDQSAISPLRPGWSLFGLRRSEGR